MHIKLEKNVCRVCFQNSGEIPLFSGQGETPFEMIRLAFKIEVVNDDKLPNSVCIICLEHIKNALKTSEKIINSEMHLSIYMETNNPVSGVEQASKLQINAECAASSAAPVSASLELDQIKTENFDDSSLDLEDNVTGKTEPPTNIGSLTKLECEICGAKFNSTENLVAHKKLHLGTLIRPKKDFQTGALIDSPDIIPNDQTGENEELDIKNHYIPLLIDSNSIPPPKRPLAVVDQSSPVLKKNKFNTSEQGCSQDTSFQSTSRCTKTFNSTGTQTDAKNIDNSYVIAFLQNFLMKEFSHLRMRLDEIENTIGSQKRLDLGMSLPINSVETVEDLEIKLSNDSFRNTFTEYVRKIHGKETTYDRLIRHLFSDDILSQYNWQGEKGKRGLKALSLFSKILYEAIGEDSLASYENKIKNVVRRAHQRRLKKTSRENTLFE